VFESKTLQLMMCGYCGQMYSYWWSDVRLLWTDVQLLVVRCAVTVVLRMILLFSIWKH